MYRQPNVNVQPMAPRTCCRSGLSLTERWAVQGRCPLSSFSKNNSTDSNTLSVLSSFGQESFAPFFLRK